MPKRCVLGGCSNDSYSKVPLFGFPDNPLGNKWDRFVMKTRSDWCVGKHTKTVYVCGFHFEEGDFSNYQQWKRGFVRCLRLEKDASPTVLPSKVTDLTRAMLTVTPNSVEIPTILLQPVMGIIEADENAEPLPKKGKVESQRPVLQKLAGKRMIDDHKRDVVKRAAEEEERLRIASLPKTVSTQTEMPTADAICQTEVGVKCQESQTDEFGKCSMGVQAEVVTDMATESTQTLPPPTESIEIQCDRYTFLEVVEDNEEEEEEEENEQDIDPDFMAANSIFRSTPDEPVHRKERYIFVAISKLMTLLSVCGMCAGSTTVTEICQDKFHRGTLFVTQMSCSVCQHVAKWTNQSFIRTMPVFNLQLSAAILMSGCPFTKVCKMFDFLKLHHISESGYYRHCRLYIFPNVISFWRLRKEALIAEASQQPNGLVVQGDGRSDSPGHCAKFGTYTFLESGINKIITFNVVQSSEVGGAYHCELEGLKRCITDVGEANLSVIVTDRHRQIAKWLRENVHAAHYYDVWHVAKAVGKKIDAVAKTKNCEVLAKWRKGIVHHLYWSATSSPAGDGELILAKWLSVLDHVQNVHTGFESEKFQACEHAEDLCDRPWIEPGSEVAVKLEKVIDATYLKNDIKKLSSGTQTSSLESYHSLMLGWVPKHTAYSYVGMIARTAIASLHYNENSGRAQAENKAGTPRYTVEFPKAKKGEPTVKKVKEAVTYEYAEALMESLLEQYASSPGQLRTCIDDLHIPAPLTSLYTKPIKADAVKGYITRFQ